MLVGVNVGSKVRPEIALTPGGVETLASFYAGGGSITFGRPALGGMNSAKIRVSGDGRGYVQSVGIKNRRMGVK